MKLLQRYILFDLLRVFLALLSVLTVLLMFVGVFKEVSESGLGPMQVLQILPFIVPSLLPFTIPATMLLTVCLVYGRMAGDLEITAAKSAGINVMSMLWPTLVLGGVTSVCSLVLSDQVIPWAMANIQRTVTQAMEDIFLDVLRSRHQVSDARRGFTITVMGVEDRTLLFPTFQYVRNGGEPVTIQAQEARLEFDLDNEQVWLHLVRGHIDVPGQRRVWFEREDRPFPLPSMLSEPKPRHLDARTISDRVDEFVASQKRHEEERDAMTALSLATGDFQWMRGPEMQETIDRIHVASRSVAKHRTELHSRLALSTSCFFFVWLGAPVAILQARRQFLTTFLLCFLPILLAYYPIVLGMMSLAKTGVISPVWSMWVANVGLGIAGGWFLYKVLRH